MSLACRNLYQYRLRLFLSAAGVALSVMLMLILSGFSSGVYEQATYYPENSNVVLEDPTSDTRSSRARKAPRRR